MSPFKRQIAAFKSPRSNHISMNKLLVIAILALSAFVAAEKGEQCPHAKGRLAPQKSTVRTGNKTAVQAKQTTNDKKADDGKKDATADKKTDASTAGKKTAGDKKDQSKNGKDTKAKSTEKEKKAESAASSTLAFSAGLVAIAGAVALL